ncbi:hypothetical protein SCOR_29755 [Sulfidibacter corallicola]
MTRMQVRFPTLVPTPLCGYDGHHYGGDCRLCNPGGVSPSMQPDLSRITGSIFTVRNSLCQCQVGLDSLNHLVTDIAVPRRVDRSGLEILSKVDSRRRPLHIRVVAPPRSGANP